ncbi:hypothetical protein BpHYR1_015093 [Brachionus plicatilis]|uniref:Uncharacterized protein n=1 Tax=Brachionus plicatilis TaxID=10195 RepID=A0A3M7PL71_BRAPC|nr:hypothetical protein BpHYR1_015093 [Brachionus plicatilis]
MLFYIPNLIFQFISNKNLSLKNFSLIVWSLNHSKAGSFSCICNSKIVNYGIFNFLNLRKEHCYKFLTCYISKRFLKWFVVLALTV